MIDELDSVKVLVGSYDGNVDEAMKVFDTLKYDYDHHPSNLVKPTDMFIDEHIHYVNGLDNYIARHIKTYYPAARK